MHISQFAKASGLLALALVPLAGGAAGVLRCDPAPRWQDFSAISMQMRGDGRLTGGDGPVGSSTTLTLATTVFDDGSRMVVDGIGPHTEIIHAPRSPHDVFAANDRERPLQLAEAAMFYDLPLTALKQKFGGPCELQDKTRYPFQMGGDDDSASGEFERDGDAVRVVVKQTRSHDTVSSTSRLVFAAARGKLPAQLDLRGWTVFHDSIRPEDGQPSRFATLGEFLNSLPAPTHK